MFYKCEKAYIISIWNINTCTSHGPLYVRVKFVASFLTRKWYGFIIKGNGHHFGQIFLFHCLKYISKDEPELAILFYVNKARAMFFFSLVQYTGNLIFLSANSFWVLYKYFLAFVIFVLGHNLEFSFNIQNVCLHNKDL